MVNCFFFGNSLILGHCTKSYPLEICFFWTFSKICTPNLHRLRLCIKSVVTNVIFFHSFCFLPSYFDSTLSVRIASWSDPHTFVPFSPYTLELRIVHGEIDPVLFSIWSKIPTHSGTAISGWKLFLSHFNKFSHILSLHSKWLLVVQPIS